MSEPSIRIRENGPLLIKGPVQDMLEQFKFRDALYEVMDLARKGNKYLQVTEPWKKATQLEKESGKVLGFLHSGKFLESYKHCVARQIFGFERVAVRRQNELGLALCSRRTCLERGQSFRDRARCGNSV